MRDASHRFALCSSRRETATVGSRAESASMESPGKWLDESAADGDAATVDAAPCLLLLLLLGVQCEGAGGAPRREDGVAHVRAVRDEGVAPIACGTAVAT